MLNLNITQPGVDGPQLVYPLIARWTLLAVVNNAAMNMGTQISFQVPAA